MISYHYKSETLISILVVIFLFSIVLFSFNQWQQKQLFQQNTLFQQQQALLLAENQISLILAEKPCDKSMQQNGVQFNIFCDQNSVTIQYGLNSLKIIQSQ